MAPPRVLVNPRLALHATAVQFLLALVQPADRR